MNNNNNLSSYSPPYVIEHNTKSRFAISNIKSLYIDPTNINYDSFYKLILSNFRVNVTYSVLFKVKYNDLYFGMLGSQIGIRLSGLDADDTKSVQKLYKKFTNSIEIFEDEYPVEYINLIQLMYVTIGDVPKLKLENLNKIKLNKEFVKIKDERYGFSSRFLPFTTDIGYFGRLLLDEERLRYLNIINKEKSILFFKEITSLGIDSIYLYKNTYLILNRKISDVVIRREIYYAETGQYINTFTDTIITKNTFKRTKGNLTLTISKGKVTYMDAYKDLSIIKYNAKSYTESPNPLIGSLDLETFEDLDGFPKVYALGFMVLGEKPHTFYIDKSDSDSNCLSDELLLKCFDNILISKYDGYIFYTHNFGGYDSVFILKILKEANYRKGFEYYKLDPLYRDNKMLKLGVKVRKVLSDRNQAKIGVRKEPGFIKITIADSYTLLNDNLFDLSSSFNIEVTKGYFPHSFVKRNTLNYIGNTPSIEFWRDIVLKDKNISDEQYKLLDSKVWNLKDESIKYLDKDLESLLNIMDTFNKYIYRNYDIQMTDSLTISRLAMNIYLKDYLKQSSLPIIKSNMYKDIKQAYFGGVTEVYKPYGRNLYYYDVNSLYPFSSINPIPGRYCNYLEDLSSQGLDLKNLFGFFYCEIETEDKYLGLLPVRSEEGIIMPNGKWNGWYFSEELKFAAYNNYSIKVIKGYNFDKQENVFNEYVSDLYKVKLNSDGHIKVIAKSLLNNLIGRFGMNINKVKTEIVNKAKLEEIQSTRVYNSYPIEITNNDYLISYYPEISKELCESHGKDYFKVYTHSTSSIDMEVNKEFKDVSLTTAAVVTSYARVFMSKIKLDILSKGGNIYYTDTDSIVTDIPLNYYLVGNNLGQFKLEHEVKEAYFITSKTYCLVLKDNSVKIKVKGAYNSTLSLKDFIHMYNGLYVMAIKRDTITYHEMGSVLINNKGINLSSDSYKKREKIYLDNKWVDTKPLMYKTPLDSKDTDGKDKKSDDDDDGGNDDGNESSPSPSPPPSPYTGDYDTKVASNNINVKNSNKASKENIFIILIIKLLTSTKILFCILIFLLLTIFLYTEINILDLYCDIIKSTQFIKIILLSKINNHVLNILQTLDYIQFKHFSSNYIKYSINQKKFYFTNKIYNTVLYNKTIVKNKNISFHKLNKGYNLTFKLNQFYVKNSLFKHKPDIRSILLNKHKANYISNILYLLVNGKF